MKVRGFVALAFVVVCAAVGVMVGLFLKNDPKIREELEVRGIYFSVPIPHLPEGARRPSRTIYLNREGAHLTRGVDESSKNVTSLVPERVAGSSIPAYTGSNATWRTFAKCVRDKFEAFDVEVVEQRPVQPGYLMVVVGGTAEDLGRGDNHHATGLAPFNGEAIPNAVVIVFSQALKNSSTAMCETAGMEVGHAYGLDHARHCSDLMTYMKRCGARTFLDKDLKCGEHEDRACPKDAPTQNSHQHLLALLGPKRTARSPVSTTAQTSGRTTRRAATTAAAPATTDDR